MKISEMITDKYKLRITPTVYYELLADVQEVEEEQAPTTKNDLGAQMTNGEKMISAFPNGEVRKCEKGVVFSTGGWCHAYAEEWWNAEYKEPTKALEQEPYPCDTCKHNKDPWFTEPCDSCCGSDGYEQKYIEREVLDKIKAKIEQSRYGLDDGLDLALNIIDECVSESEST